MYRYITTELHFQTLSLTGFFSSRKSYPIRRIMSNTIIHLTPLGQDPTVSGYPSRQHWKPNRKLPGLAEHLCGQAGLRCAFPGDLVKKVVIQPDGPHSVQSVERSSSDAEQRKHRYGEIKMFYQCCGSGMFIPDTKFFHSGSQIRIKEFKYYNPKKWFLSSRKYDLGCSSRPDPDHDFYPSRIRGSKRHRIPDPDPQHCVL